MPADLATVIVRIRYWDLRIPDARQDALEQLQAAAPGTTLIDASDARVRFHIPGHGVLDWHPPSPHLITRFPSWRPARQTIDGKQKGANDDADR